MDNSSKVEMDYKQSSHYGETVMMKSPKTYGALGYLNPDIYNERHNDDKFKRLLDICIEENKMTLVVQHHKKKYSGHFLIWVIIEFFSMGMLSYLYADLKSVDQKKIARELYHTSSVCLKSWLRCLTDLRNPVLIIQEYITGHFRHCLGCRKMCHLILTGNCFRRY